MRILTADQGNTLLKLALYDGDKLIETAAVDGNTPEDALPIIDSWHPQGGIFCSVGRFDSRLVETMRRLADGRMLVMTPHTPLPFAVSYATPATLGVDRLAVAAGAGYLFGDKADCAVADCGSAVTVDLVSRGVFRGGRIAPGVAMRFRALHDFTARLPLIPASGENPLAGDSTQTSLRSGVVRGVAAELAGALADYKSLFGIRRLLLTGGDSRLLYPVVMESVERMVPDGAVLYHSNLLNIGLLSIFRHNLRIGAV